MRGAGGCASWVTNTQVNLTGINEDTLNTEFENIAAETPAAEAAPAAYPFDQDNYEVELNVSADPDRERLIYFRFRRPTDAEEIKRETDSWVQLKGEDQHSNRDKADELYFDLLLTETKGIITANEPKELAKEWRTVTPAIREALEMYPQWKREAVGGLRGGVAVLTEKSEDEDFTVIGASVTIPVDYFFPSEEQPEYRVHFEIPAPTEREKKQYEDKIIRVEKSKRRNGPTKIIADLTVGSELFLALMNRPGAEVTGATVQGKTFNELNVDPLRRGVFLNAINPVIRARVIGAAMNKYVARLRD